MPRYYTVKLCIALQNPGFKGFLAETVWKKTNFDVIFSSGIINLLFDGLTYNTRGHFAHSSYFILAPSGLGKILRNSQNIRTYYMSNHRIRCMYSDDTSSACKKWPSNFEAAAGNNAHFQKPQLSCAKIQSWFQYLCSIQKSPRFRALQEQEQEKVVPTFGSVADAVGVAVSEKREYCQVKRHETRITP